MYRLFQPDSLPQKCCLQKPLLRNPYLRNPWAIDYKIEMGGLDFAFPLAVSFPAFWSPGTHGRCAFKQG